MSAPRPFIKVWAIGWFPSYRIKLNLSTTATGSVAGPGTSCPSCAPRWARGQSADPGRRWLVLTIRRCKSGPQVPYGSRDLRKASFRRQAGRLPWSSPGGRAHIAPAALAARVPPNASSRKRKTRGTGWGHRATPGKRSPRERPTHPDRPLGITPRTGWSRSRLRAARGASNSATVVTSGYPNGARR